MRTIHFSVQDDAPLCGAPDVPADNVTGILRPVNCPVCLSLLSEAHQRAREPVAVTVVEEAGPLFTAGMEVVANMPGSWVHGRIGTVIASDVTSSDGIRGCSVQYEGGYSVVEPECLIPVMRMERRPTAPVVTDSLYATWCESGVGGVRSVRDGVQRQTGPGSGSVPLADLRRVVAESEAVAGRYKSVEEWAKEHPGIPADWMAGHGRADDGTRPGEGR